MKIPSSILTMLAGITLTLVSLWVGQNHGLMPTEASQEAFRVDQLFNAMMVIAVGLFILVQGTLIVVAIRFRRRAGDETDGSPVHGNVPLEILWTAIPTVIVLAIGVFSFDVYMAQGNGLDPMGHGMSHHKAPTEEIAHGSGAAIAAPLPLSDALAQTSPAMDAVPRKTTLTDAPQPLMVNVTGLQFAWIFNYPDSGVVSGELHVPVGRLVQLNLSASDVIHAFWVPQFRLKQDVIPGRETQLRFTPTRLGGYPVICAELCGSYHGGMKTQVLVETPDGFNDWMQSQQVASSEALDQTVALQPATSAPSDFLAPYADELGIQPSSLQYLSTPSSHRSPSPHLHS
ncbi:cytochrome C oxidase subunit II [Neosynechococcus sphagnicola sy1]|uniref:Cytochrome c oxidase subunit 2 n=1 Tax=Neosynechococcus sphagnicola sy1 TaxID=1497020 RepID=A0A098TIG2_9CYAN|nr:cytochrome c oxidase subunit II [Neosynechococcus sphagnicola]KGF72360.1 cytochrome C oxidase subunit II [Neosynechococcus sphagnicola sy1]